ncbi:MAG: chemotaxis protein CheX [Vicinamibacterales bacterium]
MVAREDIVRIVDEIWLTTLGFTARPAEAEVSLPGDAATIDGIVNITGDQQVAVVLQVPKSLAERIASAMFGLGSRTPRAEDMQDAVGELSNMLGGNVKALLSGSCHLSLPAVVHGEGYTIRVPTSHSVDRITFECEGMPAVVSVMSAPMGKAAAA